MSKTLVAVYGTLLSGMGNHVLLTRNEGDVKPLGAAKGDFYCVMYSAGGFPILSMMEPEDKVICEIYEVGDETLADLDRLEGYPGWYNRTVRSFIMDETGETVRAYIYHQNDAQDMPVVPKADWRSYRNGGNR